MESHICIAANTTWYVHNFRSRLIASFISSGLDVTVFSPTDKYVDRIEGLGARHIHLEMNNAGTNPLREIMTILGIQRTIAGVRPDVLLTYTPKVNIYCSLAARPLGIPVIANISGLGKGFVDRGWTKTVSKLLYRVALTHPSKVFFQNNDDLDEFVGAGLVKRHQVDRLPGSGVDLVRFAGSNQFRDDGECRFLFTSRLLWDKGLAEYVEAARRLRREFPHARFRLLGFLDVANPSAVPRRTVEAWHDEGVIEYLGSTDDVVPHLAQVDCAVLPSFYREGVPRSLIEAAAMGLPLVTTDMPGCRDVVEDGVNGFLCRPRDADDLYQKMRRIVEMSPDERRAMGLAGRAKMEREFDERIVLRRYSEALDEVFKHSARER